MQFTVKTPEGADMTLTPRLSFVLERVGDRWLLIHYAESATVQD